MQLGVQVDEILQAGFGQFTLCIFNNTFKYKNFILQLVG
jgi:hypothetical protein